MTRMKRLILSSVLMLAGCYDYGTFLDEAWAEECARMDECGLLAQLNWTLEECVASRDADTGTFLDGACDTFDKNAGQSCVSAIQSVSCEDYLGGRGMDDCDLVCGRSQ